MDIFFGFKVIALHPKLSSASKTVGAIILDHYNRKTGQCDPSIKRLAKLSGLNKSSVVRAIKELGKIGLVTRISHGGGHERNRYLPNFEFFHQTEEKWREAFKNGSTEPVLVDPPPNANFNSKPGANLPPQELQKCDRSMRSDPTSGVAEMRNKPISITNTKNLDDSSLLTSNSQGNVVNLNPMSIRAQAALNRAVDRLSKQINKHPKSSIIWANCDEKMHDEAALLEMNCRGKGIEFLLNELGVSSISKSASNLQTDAS